MTKCSERMSKKEADQLTMTFRWYFRWLPRRIKLLDDLEANRMES